MGGIFYKSGGVYPFTDDQVKRLPHLLEGVIPMSETVENEKSFLENTAQDKMIGSEKRGRGRPKIK